MPVIIQHFYEELLNNLLNSKTDKDKDPVFIDILKRMANSLRCDVYVSNINMNFSNKFEAIKLYRQSVINSRYKDIFSPLVWKRLRIKVLLKAVVYGNDTKILGNMSLAQLHDLSLLA